MAMATAQGERLPGEPSAEAASLSARASRVSLPSRLTSSGSLLRRQPSATATLRAAASMEASRSTTASLAARPAGSAGRLSALTARSNKGSASAASTGGTGGSSRSAAMSRRSSTSCSSCTGTRSSTTTGTTSSRRTSSSSGTTASTAASGDTSRATYSDSKSTASRRSISTIEEEDGGDDPLGRRAWPGGSLADLKEEVAEAAAGERTPSATPAPSTPSWPGSEAGWDEEKWLVVAARHDAQRRTATSAGWEARKAMFPELFRSDASICPSYSQFQVPYWSVCRRRHLLAKRRIDRRLAEDIEELALLQTRALDGVRVVRCFSLGARPSALGPGRPGPGHLTEQQRRRVEQLVSGHALA